MHLSCMQSINLKEVVNFYMHACKTIDTHYMIMDVAIYLKTKLPAMLASYACMPIIIAVHVERIMAG